MTKAVQRLTLQSYPRHPMDSYVPASLRSITMPLARGKDNTAASVSSSQTEDLPAVAAYTPRMIEVSIKDGDKQPGELQERQLTPTQTLAILLDSSLQIRLFAALLCFDPQPYITYKQ